MTSAVMTPSPMVILDHVLNRISEQSTSYATSNRTQSAMTRVFAKMMAEECSLYSLLGTEKERGKPCMIFPRRVNKQEQTYSSASDNGGSQAPLSFLWILSIRASVHVSLRLLLLLLLLLYLLLVRHGLWCLQSLLITKGRGGLVTQCQNIECQSAVQPLLDIILPSQILSSMFHCNLCLSWDFLASMAQDFRCRSGRGSPSWIA